ncbi:MAG: hypothetical protein JGK21_26850 [Microcoleus sp. PH2017_22_RUC_O_B]|uniref:hypothetical protein n=2 Tax=unclassified Microcoleus TaxID=2642155 RepID=UPI001D97D465|nr:MULTISPECIES: hypothetical protein [unclassified Microcoleus]MCC3531091.1 hypothetical protein [Microcoleus sp. PH2017_21_RUC_O_A]MCC3543904.1 hypothetical protein [Microcoleus sp. PH2017_22_RUC_O_B]
MNEQELDELRAQLAAARAQIEELQQANDEMRDRIRSQSETINRAKDITPFSRPSFFRVKALARAALLDLSKAPGGGWLLSMGSRVRKFKTLVQIWDILCLEDWNLEDLLGDYLVSKCPLKKIVPVLTQFWDGFRIDVYGDLVSDDILSQAQNSFEIWNHCLSG